MINLSIFKILGIFSTLIILGIFLSGTIFGIAEAVKEGSWQTALKATGGRLFSVDYALREETNLLLSPDSVDEFYDKSIYMFHVAYCLILLFMLFVIFYALFKFGNWIVGIKQFSPGTDIMIALMLFLLYFVLEFLYVQIVLKETMIPIIDGVWYFVKNLPKIIQNVI